LPVCEANSIYPASQGLAEGRRIPS